MQVGRGSPIETVHLGVCADLRYLYPGGEPGCDYVRSAEVVANPYGIQHITREHPERASLLAGEIMAIRRAVESPELVSRHLDYRTRAGHWSQAIAASALEQRAQYVVVVFSLANMPGEPESEFHQMITLYPAKRRYFYGLSEAGSEVLKKRWLEVTKQKTGV